MEESEEIMSHYHEDDFDKSGEEQETETVYRAIYKRRLGHILKPLKKGRERKASIFKKESRYSPSYCAEAYAGKNTFDYSQFPEDGFLVHFFINQEDADAYAEALNDDFKYVFKYGKAKSYEFNIPKDKLTYGTGEYHKGGNFNGYRFTPTRTYQLEECVVCLTGDESLSEYFVGEASSPQQPEPETDVPNKTPHIKGQLPYDPDKYNSFFDLT